VVLAVFSWPVHTNLHDPSLAENQPINPSVVRVRSF